MPIQESRKNSLKINGLVTFFLLLLVPVMLPAADDPVLLDSELDSAEQMASFQQQLEDLEFEFGPYHRNLVEPLQSMVELLEQEGDFEQIAQLQDRQLQIMRAELGFEHPDLIPLLQSMITTQMALGEWEKVSEYLGQIRYLHASIDADDTEILLSSIQDQINWLYKRIAIDERKEQVRHFFEVRELYEDIEDIVEASYGDDSLEAIPWLYKIAYNDYHLVRFLNASDGVGFDAVDRLVRQEGGFYLDTYNRNTSFFNNSSTILIVEEGKPIGEAYLRASSALVNKIEDIVIEKSDLEAQAMAKIYRADYLRIADRGSAIGSYREAAKMLQEAGIPEQDLRWFFERPMVIPVQTYHMRFADMLKELKQRSAAIESVPAEVIHLGVFTAWTEALDSTPMPENDPPFWQSENAFQYVDLSFDVSSRGIASSVDILATSKEESTSKGRIWRSMRDIDFRPAIIDNKMRRVKDVQLRYQFVDK